MTLQELVLNRMRAGALVTVVEEADEALAMAACKMAAELIAPGKVQVLSMLDKEFPDKLMAHKNQGRGVLIVSDLLAISQNDLGLMRLLREFCVQVKTPPYPRMILIESPGVNIPALIRNDIDIVKAKLPSVDELRQELEQFLRDQKITLEGNGEMRYALASAGSGLPRMTFARLLARCWVDNKKLEPRWLREAKSVLVTERNNGAVEFFGVDDVPEVGGNELLIEWLNQTQKIFNSEKAKKYGLKEPKGLLLVGVPRTGKSLTVKAIAKQWGLPLIRLDMGKVYGSLVGQSEANLRLALESAEACSPCVVWVDEIEKALGGSKGASGDSGTSQRILGAILTWLQEKKSPVFVVATANRVVDLPPELLGKGRFDEIFFTDLPDEVEREDIAGIHLRMKNKDDNGLDKLSAKAIAEYCEGFAGAEVEQVIESAMKVAYADGGRAVTIEDIKAEVDRTVPLCKTMAEDIDKLRAWAKGRARFANKRAANASANGAGVVRSGITQEWKSL